MNTAQPVDILQANHRLHEAALAMLELLAMDRDRPGYDDAFTRTVKLVRAAVFNADLVAQLAKAQQQAGLLAVNAQLGAAVLELLFVLFLDDESQDYDKALEAARSEALTALRNDDTTRKELKP